MKTIRKQYIKPEKKKSSNHDVELPWNRAVKGRYESRRQNVNIIIIIFFTG